MKRFLKLIGLDKYSISCGDDLTYKKLANKYNTALGKNIELLLKVEQLEKLSKIKPVKTVSTFNSNQTYWVVTQNNYYMIKGSRLMHGTYSTTTYHAITAGFIVETEEHAKQLLENIQWLVTRK